jgi:hypothetical protein
MAAFTRDQRYRRGPRLRSQSPLDVVRRPPRCPVALHRVSTSTSDRSLGEAHNSRSNWPRCRYRADRASAPRLPPADRRSSDLSPARDAGQLRDRTRCWDRSGDFPRRLGLLGHLRTRPVRAGGGHPLKRGGTRDMRRVPFDEQTEELVQVLRGSGVTLGNHVERYAINLSWNADDFPSFLLWFSNRGRQFDPWRGRHLALGVEPVCSAFDLGTAISSSPNPLNARGIRTAQDFVAGKSWTARYRIAVEGLGGRP